ncbi:hypothetical protein HY605_05470 [Candidatus Peregrinibacteria bacterium]|nr:hypothetical protein [Candidatus Peregrinibacteria bacterium]
MKNRKWGQTPFILCLGFVIFLGSFLYAQNTEEKDTMLNALQDELARSSARLKLEKFDLPYYIAYRVDDFTTYTASASFGALTGEGEARSRSLDTDVRVGSYVLDSSGYGGGYGSGIPLDDDYDAFRYAIWLATDRDYKAALDTLARKKAYLETQKMEERPDDFSKEDAVVLLQPLKKFTFAKDRWKELAKKTSAIFKQYPDINQSGAAFSAAYSNRYLVNSENFKERITDNAFMYFTAEAQTQSEDGMPLGDVFTYFAYTEEQMPKDDEILSATTRLADKVVALCKAPKAEDYRGPVLFEGNAAGEFFASALAYNLISKRPEEAEYGINMNAKLGKVIMPKFINCYDDPTQFEFNGKPLMGSYTVDDDGVKGQRVDLIQEGKPITLYMSRVPTKEIKKTNGHSQRGRGGPANLFVESSDKMPMAELKKKLLEEADAEGLEYALLAKKLGGYGSGSGQINIPAPIELYRVYVKDGKEELIRGGSFEGGSLRTLRDIIATGDDTTVYNSFRGRGAGISIICPSILIKELDLKKPPQKFEKPPLTKNPYFEVKEIK